MESALWKKGVIQRAALPALLTVIITLFPLSVFAVSLSLGGPGGDLQAGADVPFTISLSVDQGSSPFADVYAILVYPDGSLQDIATSSSPGTENLIIPAVTSWPAASLQGSFAWGTAGYPVGTYSLWFVFMRPGKFDNASLIAYDHAEFALRSTCSASGSYPGHMPSGFPPEYRLPIPPESNPAKEVHLNVQLPAGDLAGLCHIASITQLLNYFGAHVGGYEAQAAAGLGTPAVMDSFVGKLMARPETAMRADLNLLGNFHAPFVVGTADGWGEFLGGASGRIEIRDGEQAKQVLKAALASGFPVMVHGDLYELRNVPGFGSYPPRTSDSHVVTGYAESGVTLNLGTKDVFVDWDTFMREWYQGGFTDPTGFSKLGPYWMLFLTGEYHRSNACEIAAWLKVRGQSAYDVLMDAATRVHRGQMSPLDVDYIGFRKDRAAMASLLEALGKADAASHYRTSATIWGVLESLYVNGKQMDAYTVAGDLVTIAREEKQALDRM